MSQNTQAAAAAKSKFSVRDICYAGLFAAVITVMAQISIPMPLGVPMTMQTFAITLAAVVLGSKLSAIASLVYLALGAVGVPCWQTSPAVSISSSAPPAASSFLSP